MKKLKLISLFAFGVSIIISFIFWLFMVISEIIGSLNLGATIDIITSFPLVSIIGVYIFFIPLFVTGVIATFLKLENKMENFVYLFKHKMKYFIYLFVIALLISFVRSVIEIG